MSDSSAPCQFVLERQPRRGAWNMALDEALLLRTLETGEAWFRWYRWNSATLSLGYFQGGRESIDPRWSTLPVVRRLSGGGAILHDVEWTYSCTIPGSHPLAVEPRQLYHALHLQVIQSLTELGFQTRFRGLDAPSKPAHAFLCFERGDPLDLLCGDFKFLGSAQRRRRGAILQHGSLILRKSPWAPEIPGLFDLAERELSESTFVGSCLRQVPPVLGTVQEVADYPPEILAQAESFCREKYDGTINWNRGGSVGENSDPGT